MADIDHADAHYMKAVGLTIVSQRCSTSYTQRLLGLGYSDASALVQRMEKDGLVSAPNHVGKREVLVKIAGVV